MNARNRRPEAAEFAPFYARYVERVPDGDVCATLRRQGNRTAALLAEVGEQRAGHRYAPDKWTIREVVGHVADTERVMAYRALCFARGDATPLPGFDENAYAAASGADARTLDSLAAELAVVRAATVALLEGLPAEAWDRTGSASGTPVSVRGLAWIIAGHELHHRMLLEQRYLAQS